MGLNSHSKGENRQNGTFCRTGILTYVKQLDYHFASKRKLDIEIYSVSNLRHRVGDDRLQPTFRYKFHVLMGVTRGESVHTVDFKPVHCAERSILSIQPAQSHRFNFDHDWDGWMIIFRPEFLLSNQISKGFLDLKRMLDFDSSSGCLALDFEQFDVATNAVTLMQKDLNTEAAPENIHALLRHQLHALVLRLAIRGYHKKVSDQSTSVNHQRFRAFQSLLEDNFIRWHQVADYACALGCSNKSLTRAVADVSGENAKTSIAARINLEAKRLLVQTDSTVAVIGESLGFEETTSFVKFFKREGGITPGEFRRNQFAHGN